MEEAAPLLLTVMYEVRKYVTVVVSGFAAYFSRIRNSDTLLR